MQIILVNTIARHTTFTLNVEPADTMNQVKAKIHDQEGIPVNIQQWVWAGKLSENAKTFSDCNVPNEAKVHI